MKPVEQRVVQRSERLGSVVLDAFEFVRDRRFRAAAPGGIPVESRERTAVRFGSR